MSLDNMTSVELHAWAEKISGAQKLRAENERLRAENADMLVALTEIANHPDTPSDIAVMASTVRRAVLR